MKTFKILGFEIRYFLSIRKVERLSFDLPDWADDVHVASLDVNDDPIPPIIKYYKCSTVFYIHLPTCKEAVKVSLSPRYEIIDGKRAVATNRKIVVDIYK